MPTLNGSTKRIPGTEENDVLLGASFMRWIAPYLGLEGKPLTSLKITAEADGVVVVEPTYFLDNEIAPEMPEVGQDGE